MRKQVLPIVRGTVQQVRAGQIRAVRARDEKRPELGHHAPVIDCLAGTEIPGARNAIRQIHAGIDGGDQALARGPGFKRQRLFFRTRRFHGEIEIQGIDAQEHHFKRIASVELRGKQAELKAFLQLFPRRERLKNPARRRWGSRLFRARLWRDKRVLDSREAILRLGRHTVSKGRDGGQRQHAQEEQLTEHGKHPRREAQAAPATAHCMSYG